MFNGKKKGKNLLMSSVCHTFGIHDKVFILLPQEKNEPKSSACN